MPETAMFCLTLLGVVGLILLVIVAASPWLCRPRIDTDALAAARRERLTRQGVSA